MKVAQIAPPWFAVPPVRYGGIEWVVALLADGLADHGHDVTLYASGGSITKAELVTVFEDPPGGQHIGEVFYDVMQASIAYREAASYDIIHDHSGLIGPAIGAHVATPVVHTLHGPFTEEAKQIYTLLSGSIHYVAISEAQRAFCPDLSYAATVHNGIDVARYPFRTEKEDFLLFLGRINREKGPELAVDVAHRTGRKLVMAVKMAEKPEQRYWDEIVAPRLDGSEEILGEITTEEKADLLARAHAVLFPIQWPEPFGLVMTEAMASGTPVISFAYGAAPEVIVDGKTGFLVKTLDEMCEAVERVPTIRPEDCRAHVEKHFSDQVMVEGYERAFERVLAGKV
jgi:glycosyltransferase involved in cell wall biosynthesis